MAKYIHRPALFSWTLCTYCKLLTWKCKTHGTREMFENDRIEEKPLHAKQKLIG